MRLTLRTLLAYLDNVLNPTDRAVLAQKIDESAKAAQLRQTIERSLGQTDLGAAPPLADGIDDANQTAEYLDNTLPAGDVAGFEQICLASDQRLAEVADCHKILSEVLTQPVHVPPSARERAYRLASALPGSLNSSVTSIPTAPPAPNGAALPQPRTPRFRGAATASPPVVSTPQTKTPLLTRSDLPRREVSRLISILVTAALLILFVGVLLQTVQPLLRLLGQKDNSSVIQPDAVSPDVIVDPPDTKPKLNIAPNEVNVPPSPQLGPDDNNSEKPPSAETKVDDADRMEPKDPAALEIEQPADPTVKVEMADLDKVKPKPVVDPTIEPDGEVARLISEQTLLISFDSVKKQWQRVERDQPLSAPITVISPPIFRNRLILRGGLDVSLIGSTSFRVPETNEVVPSLDLEYGRMIIGTTSANVDVPCNLHGIRGILTLSDLRAVVAADVQVKGQMGRNPELPNGQQLQIEWIGVQGSAVWNPEVGDPLTISTGQRLLIEANQMEPPNIDAGLPSWLEPEPLGAPTIPVLASSGLATLIASNKSSIDLALRDAIHVKKSEVVSLAVTTLVLIGGADMMFGNDGVLSKVTQKAYWSEQLRSLQDEVGRGEEHAARVRSAIDQMNAAESEIIYRMLWGFTNEQLASGEDAKIVDWLNHPTMLVRVLATETLRQITGTTLGYRPEVEGRREPDLLKWQSRLKQGSIRWPEKKTESPPSGDNL